MNTTAVSSISTAASAENSYNVLRKKKIVDQFMDYAATHPADAFIEYVASEMHLWVHTDASYLSETKAWLQAGGYFFLSDKPQFPITPSTNQKDPKHNHGAVHDILCKLINAVMSSTQEAKIGAGFMNAKEALPIWQALIEMGHPGTYSSTIWQ